MKKIISLALSLILLLTLAVSVSADDSFPDVYTVLFHQGSPSGIVAASDGSFLITDTFNKVVWQLVPDEDPVRLVGRIAVHDQSEEPVGGYNDADYANSAFDMPWDITPFLDGYLVSDSTNNVVRFFSNDRVQTAFGSGSAGFKNGRGMNAQLDYPTGLATDDDGNAYVADSGNNVIRKMTPDGMITTFAGSGSAGHADGSAATASFNRPTGLFWSGDALYVADTDNHVIRKIKDGAVTTVAGTTYSDADGDSLYGGAYADGPAPEACFSSPTGVAVAGDGTIYISDSGNYAIRVLSEGRVTTLMRSDADKGDPYPVSPRGLAIIGDMLFIADPFAGVVFSPDASALVSFSDVPPEAWFATPVYYGVRNGLYNGTGEREFSPYMTLSRGMLVTVLGRMAGIDALDYSGLPFSDVNADAYYAPYIAWASETGLALGRDLTADDNGTKAAFFAPDSPITRQEIVTMLYRYARNEGMTGEYYANLSNFSDASDIAQWSDEAWQWAYTVGVIKGYDDATLRPGGYATRAEMAQMCYNFATRQAV